MTDHSISTDIVDHLQEAHDSLLGRSYGSSIFLTAMGEIQRLRALTTASVETIADSLKIDLLDSGNHGCRISAHDQLDNFLIEGHVSLISLARAVTRATASDAVAGTPLMQAAQNAQKVVDSWSDSKREYADRAILATVTVARTST